MKFVIPLVIFVTFCAQAKSLDMHVDGKIKKIEITEFIEMKLTKSCFKSSKTPQCQAYSATKKNIISLNKPNTPLAGHPAAYMCGSAGGVNRVLKDDKNNEYDYCEFKDGSMIDAWDLYEKIKPSK